MLSLLNDGEFIAVFNELHMLRDETDNSFMEWLQWNENIENIMCCQDYIDNSVTATSNHDMREVAYMTRNIALDRQYEAAEVVFFVDKILPSLSLRCKEDMSRYDHPSYHTSRCNISLAARSIASAQCGPICGKVHPRYTNLLMSKGLMQSASTKWNTLLLSTPFQLLLITLFLLRSNRAAF